MTKELVTITRKDGKQLVSGRELYERLEVKSKYNDWFNRMVGYGFIENTDYFTVTQKKVTAQGNQNSYFNHLLTIPMAKELCMLQRTEIGKELRQYFIACEDAWNSPEMVLARANQIQSRMLEDYTQRIQQLETENKEQKELIEIQKPKVDFYNTVTQSETTFDMAKVAKIIKYNDENGKPLGRNKLFEILRTQDILRRNNEPYQQYVTNGWFKVVEIYDNRGILHSKTVVYQKGIDNIIKLLNKLGYEKENDE